MPKPKGKVFFVVGHKHWGKSQTLRALTNSRLKASLTIWTEVFFIRRMSNDDVPEGFYKFLERLDPAEKPLVVATLCPTFGDGKKRAGLVKALSGLKRKYELFFFVLRYRWWYVENEISKAERTELARFGKVSSFARRKAKREQRAQALRLFIKANL